MTDYLLAYLDLLVTVFLFMELAFWLKANKG